MRKYPNPPLGFDSIHNPILALDSAPCLIGNRTSAHYRGRSALDSAGGLDPNGALPTPQMRPDRAEAIGRRREGTDQGPEGALSREHCAALHDLAAKANLPEADMQGFGRVLAALAGVDPNAAPPAQDRGGAKRKISADTANAVWKKARDSGMKPADLSKLVEMLKPLVGDPDDPDLAAEGEAQTQDQDQPPPFAGRPERPGITGDQAIDFERRFPGVLRLANSDDHYGQQAQPSRRDRRTQQLALDARERAGGALSLEQRDPELAASLRRIGRA